MNGNYCTQCGAPIERDDLMFCTQCGASLANPDESPNWQSSSGGFSQCAPGGSVPAGYTMPAESLGFGKAAGYYGMQPGVPAAPAATNVAGGDSNDDSGASSIRLGIAVGAAVGAVIAAIVALAVLHPFSGSHQETEPLSVEPIEQEDAGGSQISAGTTTTDDGNAETTGEANPVEASEADSAGDARTGVDATTGGSSAVASVDYYDDLMGYYGDMQSLDQRIADCATYFNNNFTKSDYSVRQAGADDAASIHSDVNSELSSLQALAVPQDNPYHEDWQHMQELMTDLQHRIDVIDQAWQNSLSYSDPANHQDAIKAPLSVDNVDGVNRYKAHFVDNYGPWAPTKK